MAPDKKGDRSNRIPINFFDAEGKSSLSEPDESELSDDAGELTDNMAWEDEAIPLEDSLLETGESPGQPSPQADGSPGDVAPSSGGPEVAELVATRAELKRLENEVKELKDALVRRQADFENYRKRMERERAETYNRVVADSVLLLVKLDSAVPGGVFP
jgi:molecular chaperone GrpE